MKSTTTGLMTLIFLFLSFVAISQDGVFSQFVNAPLNLNPSLTGNFEGKHRFSFNYKRQWPTSINPNGFKTDAFSYDTKLNISEMSSLGLGFVAYFDKAGPIDLKTQQGNLYASMLHTFGDKSGQHHVVGLGIEAGIANQTIDVNNAMWPSQIDSNGVFNPLLPAPDLLYDQYLMADYSVGLSWNFVINPKNSLQIGAVVHHVNEPNISFTGAESILSKRYTLHASADIALTNQLSLLPAFRYLSQGQHEMSLLGSSVRWHFNATAASPSISFGILRDILDNGLVNQLTSTVYSLRYDFAKFKVGFAYDRAKLKGLQTSAFNTYELFLGYTIPDNSMDVTKEP